MKNDLLVSSEVILDCLSEGAYVCDRESRIVFWSKSAERITGWTSDEKELLTFSNDIQLQDDITIIEARLSGDSGNGRSREKT